jgi:hypothetical protein
MTSGPCHLIDSEGFECPGNVADCVPDADKKDCRNTGGTTVTVQFYPADRFANR